MNQKLIEAAQAVVDSFPPYIIGPIRDLAIALEEAKKETPPKLIVFVDGAQTQVRDIDGNICNVVGFVDHDLEEMCPVCQSDDFTGDDCPDCGYITKECNDFECAVKLIHEREG